MLSVIVPVLNEIEITDDFLASVHANTARPDEIILIDNGSTDDIRSLAEKYPDLNINYVRNENNVGVNEAWNQGVRLAKNPLISILNNDILLNEFFFAKVIETMADPEVGMCVPHTVYMNVVEGKDEPVSLQEMKSRQGWAFTIRKSIITEHDNFIPSDKIKIWCGDDYLFECAGELGYARMVMTNNTVFHHVSKTLNKEFPPGTVAGKELKRDVAAYKELKRQAEIMRVSPAPVVEKVVL